MKLKKLFLLLPVFALASCSNVKTITSQEAKDLINNAEQIEVVNSFEMKQTSKTNLTLKGSDGVTAQLNDSSSALMVADMTDADSLYFYQESISSSSYKVTGTGAADVEETIEAEIYNEIVSTDTGFVQKNLRILNDDSPLYSESSVDLSTVTNTILSASSMVLVGLSDGSDLDLFISQISAQFDSAPTITYQTHGSDVIVNFVGELDGGDLLSGVLDGVTIEFKTTCTFVNNVLVAQKASANLNNFELDADGTRITGNISLSNNTNLVLNEPVTNKDRVSNPNA